MYLGQFATAALKLRSKVYIAEYESSCGFVINAGNLDAEGEITEMYLLI